MDQKKKIMDQYVRRYPQLCLPVKNGMSKSEEYRNTALRGNIPAELPDYFKGSAEDRAFTVETPAGRVEVIYLAEREDFERAVKCLGYKCEEIQIPPSMGAVTISGITNWSRIRKHKEEYLKSGKTDWQAEFRRFTSVSGNCKDRIVLVSKGGYSALRAEETRYSQEEWTKITFDIRVFHELCHVVCRTLFPDKKNAVVDEIIADCFGILKATGFYDTVLAEKCLGILGDQYRPGGRLENYLVSGEDPADHVRGIKEIIKRIDEFIKETKNKEYWDKLRLLEETLYDGLKMHTRPLQP